MDDDRLIARIERALGAPELVDRLAELPGSDLQSLLLAVYERRSGSLSARDVLRAYEANSFVQASPLDPAALLGLEQQALSLLPPGYQPLDLSPVCPFGAAAVLGSIHQDWVLAAGRNTEVVSDPTIVLALECARRRRGLKRTEAGNGNRVNLFTAHRAVRGQRFSAPFRQHFSLIALCSAGRDDGGQRFDTATMLEHVSVYLDLAMGAVASHSAHAELRVALSPLRGGVAIDRLEEQVLRPLGRRFPGVRFDLDPQRQNGMPGYYVRACFKIYLETTAGRRNLADGGFTTWSQRLLSDRKERLLTSGLGTESLISLPAPPDSDGSSASDARSS